VDAKSVELETFFIEIDYILNSVLVGQGRHFHAECLFILRKLVSAEAKIRIILEDSYFHCTKNLYF
jgi:hypothetical protein